MDLLAASYSNIGPFLERTVGLVFHQGAYLIKAPIGSGKSFLFFDGPVFGLYKYAKRPILHRKADKGVVQILFAHEHDVRLLIRTITPTKAGGESVVSKLYKSASSKEFLEKELAGYGYELLEDWDCFHIFKETFEEIPFGSQRELDAAVQSLLPPKEATLAINFLMQDSENVFELPPASRATIFKHLFGLLGIDEAKERLSDKRKELQTTMRVLGDSSQGTEKLKLLIQDIRTLHSRMQGFNSSFPEIREGILALCAVPLMRDLTLIHEHITIEQFTIDDGLKECVQTVITGVEKHLEKGHYLQGQHVQLEQSLSETQKRHQRVMHQKEEQEHVSKQIAMQLEKIAMISLDPLIAQRNGLTERRESLENSYSRDLFMSAGYAVQSLTEAVNVVEERIVQGKELQHEDELVRTKSDHLVAQLGDLEQRKKTLEAQLHTVEVSYEQEATFYCDKIQGSCPYVELLKGQSIKVLGQQKELLQEQIAVLDKQISDHGPIQLSLEQKRHDLAKQLAALREFVTIVNWKQLKENYTQLQEIQTTIWDITKTIQSQEEQMKQRDTLLQQAQEILIKKESLVREGTMIMEQITELQKEKDTIQQAIEGLQMQDLEGLGTTMRSMQQKINLLEQIVETFKENQVRLKQLQEQEGYLKELHSIFSKELLFVVLQDFLPQLEQVINVYLKQMGEYEVRFHLPTQEGEALELEIDVYDEKGSRPVKSLSGGQKALLKISWILAVATMMRSHFLFLDETITSLDVIAVAKVADTIENFIISRNIRFYVVTHAPQIQDMTIRDGKVTVGTPQEQ